VKKKIQRFPRLQRFPRYKYVVINIRGTNGSGKTTLAKSLLESFPNRPIKPKVNPKDKILGYRIKTPGVPTFLVGPYRITTGGCDAIHPVCPEGVRPFDYICQLVAEFSKYGNVVFEGAIVATVTGRWVNLAKELPNTQWIFGFMDTPFDKCLKRVVKRRIARGDDRPLDPNVSIIPKQKAVLGSAKRLSEMGMDVRTIPHKKALPKILEWLKGDTNGR
jgi:hypothetical protein